MTKPAIMVAAILAVLCLAIPAPVQAHAAAPPLSYQTRILSDHNDDWLGVQDGHNLIALDAYPAFNATLGGELLVLRLIMSGGYAAAGSSNPPLAEHITFKAGGADKEVGFETADNAVFEGEGFAAVRGPLPQLTADGQPDGDRFFVEGLLPLASMGMKPGDALTDWFVEGHAGDAEGDPMPQGLAPDPTAPDPTGAAFNIGSYSLQSSDSHFAVSVERIAVAAGGAATLEVSISNPFKEAQTITIAGAGATATPSIADLPGRGSANVTLAVAAAQGGTTNVTISLDGSLGGHRTLAVDLAVPTVPLPTTHGHPDGNATTGPQGDDQGEASKGAPGIGFAASTIVLLAVLTWSRRR